jgi:hypothetical protein
MTSGRSSSTRKPASAGVLIGDYRTSPAVPPNDSKRQVLSGMRLFNSSDEFAAARIKNTVE